MKMISKFLAALLLAGAFTALTSPASSAAHFESASACTSEGHGVIGTKVKNGSKQRFVFQVVTMFRSEADSRYYREVQRLAWLDPKESKTFFFKFHEGDDRVDQYLIRGHMRNIDGGPVFVGHDLVGEQRTYNTC